MRIKKIYFINVLIYFTLFITSTCKSTRMAINHISETEIIFIKKKKKKETKKLYSKYKQGTSNWFFNRFKTVPHFYNETLYFVHTHIEVEFQDRNLFYW